MELIGENQNDNSVEIGLTKDELVLILKTFSNINLGLQAKEYPAMLNAGKEYVESLIGEFDTLWDNFTQDTSPEENTSLHLKCFDIDKSIFFIEINKLAFKAIHGVLSHISVWVYEEDCPFMMGVSWDDILSVKRQLLAILRETNQE
jgi:hypothetical protein